MEGWQSEGCSQLELSSTLSWETCGHLEGRGRRKDDVAGAALRPVPLLIFFPSTCERMDKEPKAISVPIERLAAAAPSRSTRWSFLPSVAVLLPFLLGLILFSASLHYSLPTPQQELFAPDGITPVFSENQALRYIYDLSTHEDGTPKYRIVGTEEMIETERYLLAAIEKIKEETALKMGGLHQVEVWHQVRRSFGHGGWS